MYSGRITDASGLIDRVDAIARLHPGEENRTLRKAVLYLTAHLDNDAFKKNTTIQQDTI